jgi:hypothetical protein
LSFLCLFQLSSPADGASNKIYLPEVAVKEGLSYREAVLEKLAKDKTLSRSDKATVQVELSKQERFIEQALVENCSHISCDSRQFAQAVGFAYERYVDEGMQQAGFQLDGNSLRRRIIAQVRMLSTFTAYAMFVTGVGKVTGLIPQSFGATSQIVAIVAGGVVGSAGAFFLDKVNNVVRTTFFVLQNGRTEAAKMGMSSFRRFESIWSIGQSAKGTVTDGRNRLKDMFISIIPILDVARSVSDFKVSHEAFGVALARARHHHWETIPDANEMETLQKELVQNEDTFAQMTLEKFGNLRSFVLILAQAIQAEPEARNINPSSDAGKEVTKKWVNFYFPMLVHWMPPSSWGADGSAFSANGVKFLRDVVDAKITDVLGTLRKIDDLRRQSVANMDQMWESMSDEERHNILAANIVGIKKFTADSASKNACNSLGIEIQSLELKLQSF